MSGRVGSGARRAGSREAGELEVPGSWVKLRRESSCRLPVAGRVVVSESVCDGEFYFS